MVAGSPTRPGPLGAHPGSAPQPDKVSCGEYLVGATTSEADNSRTGTTMSAGQGPAFRRLGGCSRFADGDLSQGPVQEHSDEF